MTLRRQDTIAAYEGRTQEALIAALFARPRTLQRAGQRALTAVASLFSSHPKVSLIEFGSVSRGFPHSS